MTSNIINESPYLRTSRNFPEEAQPLSVELNKSYVDIADKINSRSIGLFTTNKASNSGDSWYITPKKQQSFRQIYPFTSAGNIPHGIANFASQVALISPNSYGTFTDGTNWYGAVYGSNVAIAGLVTFYVTATNIVVLSGGGAPTITQGYINLEWVAQG